MSETAFNALAPAELNNVLSKYVPEDQPSPKGYIELVKTQILGTDLKGNARPVEDLIYFLNICKTTGLNPIAKQIHPVYRWDTKLGREKMSIQTGIDGLRLIAQRSKEYAGQDDIKFTPEDETADVPTKATCTVYRYNENLKQRIAYTATARWKEYVQKDKNGNPMGMWKADKMPYNQLGKCAEALALRKAFPQELSGLYVKEEMDADRGDIQPGTIKPVSDLPSPKKPQVPAAPAPKFDNKQAEEDSKKATEMARQRAAEDEERMKQKHTVSAPSEQPKEDLKSNGESATIEVPKQPIAQSSEAVTGTLLQNHADMEKEEGKA